MYLKEPRIARDQDPLKFWAENSDKYPLLVGAARKYLSIPASSAPSEREFSQTKLIARDRPRLKPGNLEMLLFLKYNLRAVDYDISKLPDVPKNFVPPNKRITPALVAPDQQTLQVYDREEPPTPLVPVQIEDGDQSTSSDEADEELEESSVTVSDSD